MNRDEFFDLIDNIVCVQDRMTQQWHTEESKISDEFNSSVMKSMLSNHLMNFKLWHTEDIARRKDVDASVIAQCKYEIDRLNQQRTDWFEATNDAFLELLTPLLSQSKSVIYNTESIGSVIDRLSILSLKIYHMTQECNRRKDTDTDYSVISDRLDTLKRQKRCLVAAFKHSVAEYIDGTKCPIQYKQFKMYNDETLNPQLYKPNN